MFSNTLTQNTSGSETQYTDTDEVPYLKIQRHKRSV